jgi:hypothetical protein
VHVKVLPDAVARPGCGHIKIRNLVLPISVSLGIPAPFSTERPPIRACERRTQTIENPAQVCRPHIWNSRKYHRGLPCSECRPDEAQLPAMKHLRHGNAGVAAHADPSVAPMLLGQPLNKVLAVPGVLSTVHIIIPLGSRYPRGSTLTTA